MARTRMSSKSAAIKPCERGCQMQPFNLLLSTMQNTACVSTTVCQLQLLQNSLPSNVQALPWSKSKRKPPRHNMDTINVDSFGLAHAIQRTSAALDPSIHRRMCHKRKLPLQCAAAANAPLTLGSSGMTGVG